MAILLNARARSTDVACRYGGEEFLLLLAQMPPQAALVRAEQSRADFAAATVVFGDFRTQATLSVGIATYPCDGTPPELLVGNADRALYRAKEGGRNRVVASSEQKSPRHTTASEALQTIQHFQIVACVMGNKPRCVACPNFAAIALPPAIQCTPANSAAFPPPPQSCFTSGQACRARGRHVCQSRDATTSSGPGRSASLPMLPVCGTRFPWRGGRSRASS